MIVPFATLFAYSLNLSFEQHTIFPTTFHDLHGEHEQRHEHVILAWYSAVLLASKECLSAISASAQQSYLSNFISLAGTVLMSDGTATSANDVQEKSHP